MKKYPFCILLILPLILLSGCIFPLQRVSPDPDRIDATADSVFYSPDITNTAPISDADEEPSLELPSASSVSPIQDPKLAVFWYAMADAHVFELREQFGPALDDSGIPFREYDAENDRYRQLDQVREAAAGGWNIFAVQLVADSDMEEAEEIIRLASGYPVIFFDRTPESGQFAEMLSQSVRNIVAVCSDPGETGRIQGKMIGEFLIRRFSNSDLNQNGQISYTYLVGDHEDPCARKICDSSLEAVNAILAEGGYRPLIFIDEENTIGFQADPDGAWSSDAGTALIRADLETYNYINSNMIELIAANNDDMALGALTALQSAWCNLGDGSSVTIPLFGIGASAAARSAVQLGQMTGTVDRNAAGYVRAVLASVRGLAEGRSAEEVLSSIAASDGECSVSSDSSCILFVAPIPVLS